MNIPPRDARDMTLWEYEATLVQWNLQHDTNPNPDPATVEDVKATEAFFAAHPELLN
jgi:hypothetical protein